MLPCWPHTAVLPLLQAGEVSYTLIGEPLGSAFTLPKYLQGQVGDAVAKRWGFG